MLWVCCGFKCGFSVVRYNIVLGFFVTIYCGNDACGWYCVFVHLGQVLGVAIVCYWLLRVGFGFGLSALCFGAA